MTSSLIVTKETVIQRLSEISDRTYIEYVTMDMWKPYKDAVNTILPHAKVVVDKFHVVRMANQALDNVRKSLKAHMSQKKDVPLCVKGLSF